MRRFLLPLFSLSAAVGLTWAVAHGLPLEAALTIAVLLPGGDAVVRALRSRVALPTVEVEDALNVVWRRYLIDATNDGAEVAWRRYMRAALDGQIGVAPQAPPLPKTLLPLLLLASLSGCGTLWGKALASCGMTVAPTAVHTGVALAPTVLQRGLAPLLRLVDPAVDAAQQLLERAVDAAAVMRRQRLRAPVPDR